MAARHAANSDVPPFVRFGPGAARAGAAPPGGGSGEAHGKGGGSNSRGGGMQGLLQGLQGHADEPLQPLQRLPLDGFSSGALSPSLGKTQAGGLHPAPAAARRSPSNPGAGKGASPSAAAGRGAGRGMLPGSAHPMQVAVARTETRHVSSLFDLRPPLLTT